MIDIWFKKDLQDIYNSHPVAVFIDESCDAEFLIRPLRMSTPSIRQTQKWRNCM